ncbi:MAG: L-threonylcarbamoyladenylate synthase [Saprospiraceae bacterium]
MIGIDVQKAAELLKSGKVVAIPTETVYGLAANALDDNAVLTIFEVKNRPFFDPLIIHVSDYEEIVKYVKNVPKFLDKLAQHFLPGPLTLLLEKKEFVPYLITSGSPYVAIRVPGHPMTQELLKLLNFPLAAPSANPFGYLSPTTAKHVYDQLGDKIPYILDGGPCEVGLESTIVGFENNRPTIFRKGGIAIEELEEVIGYSFDVKPHSTSSPQAPGMLTTHYAPKVALTIVQDEDDWKKISPKNNVGVLRVSSYLPNYPKENQKILSASGDVREAARNLFAYLRILDDMNLEQIFVELLPEKGLGMAINDRLIRAAIKE